MTDSVQPESAKELNPDHNLPGRDTQERTIKDSSEQPESGFDSLGLLLENSIIDNDASKTGHQRLGFVSLDSDGSLSVSLRTEASNILGDVFLQFKPGDPEYSKLMKQLSDLHAGDSRAIYSKDLMPIEGQTKLQDTGHEDFGSRKLDKANQLLVDKMDCSDEHAKHVKDAADSLPSNIKNFLAKRGYHYIAADKTKAALESLGVDTSIPPRGYPPGWTWDNVDGTVDKGHHKIIVSEHLKSGPWVKNERVEGVLRHETGHAIDHELGDYSHSPEFTKTFAAEVAKMPKAVRDRIGYLLQPGYAGYEEAFAEVFAVINGGGAREQWSKVLEANCPQTIALMKKKLSTLS